MLMYMFFESFLVQSFKHALLMANVTQHTETNNNDSTKINVLQLDVTTAKTNYELFIQYLCVHYTNTRRVVLKRGLYGQEENI